MAVLVGPAGTGKTFTLDAVRAAFEQAGHPVVGAAPSARAAIELAAGAGIPARTLHSLLDQWRRGYDAPRPGSLLVVDEAGMADIRTLEAVVTRQIAAGGRVLLVGDHHQLPEVGAGGGFAAATVHAGCVAELTVNRRQRQPWEQAALAELRDGSVARAVEAYLDPRPRRRHRHPGGDDRRRGRPLVRRPRRRPVTGAAGRHQRPRRPPQPGRHRPPHRRRRARRRHRRRSGRGRSGSVSGSSCGATAPSTPSTDTPSTSPTGRPAPSPPSARTGSPSASTGGAELVLTDRYLRRGGHLTHAYALTTHRAQGGTWDLAIGVGADGLYREGAYVELSRGAAENWLVLTDPEAAQLHHEAMRELDRHDTGLTPPDDEPADTRDDLIERVSRSHAKQLAHTLDPDVDRVDRLARTVPLADLEAHLAVAMAAERIATDTHGFDGADLADQIARIDHVARHVRVGGQVSPSDRHNVGTVTALDDTAGQATVQFVSADGREATRTFDWADLRIINPAGDAAHPARRRPAPPRHHRR